MMLIPAPTLAYMPEIVVETTGLPEDEWLAYRRTGIGGSDVAKILGICPFGTRRDLYYDKLNIVSPEDEEANRWQKHIGHVMEETVALMFSDVTGYPIFRLPYMFRDPNHPFMLVDLDYGCILPDGTVCILECKTTAPDATGKWWYERRPVIPLNYLYQGRHYMSVLHINKVFFACLYGNNENYLLIRELDRDPAVEDEMRFLEKDFWENHVLAENPPAYTEDGELCEESVRRHHGPADPLAPPMELSREAGLLVPRYLELGEMISMLNSQAKLLESERKRIKSIITDEMGESCSATCVIGGQPYTITFNPVYTPTIGKERLVTLQAQMPTVYKEYVSFSEQRRFYIKPVREKAA